MINTDAHKKETLDHMKIGVSTAKKGWLKKTTVLKYINKNELLAFLHDR